MENMENNLLHDLDKTSVKDLSLASYLMASGKVKLEGFDRAKNNIVYFNFTPKNIAEKLINDYWSGLAEPIQPKKLFSCQRELKDILFQGT